LCTNAENIRNRGKQKNNTIGFCGVVKHRKGFRARLQIDGRRISIGIYPTPEEAARAYDQAAIKYHAEFANLNFPQQ